jgi:hypothetical protein
MVDKQAVDFQNNLEQMNNVDNANKILYFLGLHQLYA